MFLGILTLITALTISAVAIYYSVAGLVAIFAAAAVPIIIMGSTLEVAKLVTAVWLHRYWHQATWWLKTYLSTAVVVLMFITSMGIFGFLSKAHIEQTAATGENVAQIERIDQEIARQQALIARAEQRIEGLETGGSGAQANIQTQIDREQERIENAYTRIQPAIDEQNRIIESKTQLFQDQIDKIDQDLALLQRYIDNGEIRKAQGMVGTRADGEYGPATAQAFTDYQNSKAQERQTLVDQIVALNSDPIIVNAREEIQRIRRGAEEQIAQSNELINNLRQRLSNNNSTNIETLITEQNNTIRTASSELDSLTQEKFAIEAEYRKLEAEVGPIKYIADFIYGEADKNTLEEAVRWVILIIIFVFDPLAVLLLIASQYTFNWRSQDKENDNDVSMEKVDPDADGTMRDLDTESTAPDDAETGHGVEQTEVQSHGLTPDEVARPYSEVDQPTDREIVEELGQVNDEELVEPADLDDSKKKDTSLKTEESTEPFRLTEQDLDELDKTEEWQNAKQAWKSENPTLNLKFFKQMYLEGKIDKLPWEEYLFEQKPYMMKEGNQQVTKTAEKIKSNLAEDSEPDGYIQNSEQNQDTIWKSIERGK